MKRRLLLTIALIALCLTTFILAVNDRRQLATAQDGTPTSTLAPAALRSGYASTACLIQPTKGTARARRQEMLQRRAQLLASGSFPLSRFRQEFNSASLVNDKAMPGTDPVSNGYAPREEIAFVDPTNYGDRYLADVNGNPATLEPIVVLHETVGSASSALNLFRAFHPNDNDQVSYHALIKLDGTVVYLVPPDKRAYGAGNSVFMGTSGAETVKTNAKFPGSVNNFAYHISLETPYDGSNNGYSHSGYTLAQYQALSWLVAKTGVADERITTHKAVDRSRSRIDPRSFSDTTFFSLLNAQPRRAEIAIRCTPPV
ncbi:MULTISPECIES: N-acetylmuramoyl-L-alanine amidase [Cyanophyceae]|uniref:N-acetylmuramoyl-L-alanine amidase n=1 Tax=Stenomitos frigidus AS-A4 TaxID=2933935 RepID=A0ABV0KP53_9CYAN|nr:peptidoglycan recognition family protein [Phormidium sp. FACHB-592]